MEKESEIQLLEALDQLEVCFSECVSASFMLHFYYINTSEIPSELSRENFISSHVIFTCEEITVVMVT